MRAYLIDAKGRSVREVDCDGLDDVRRLIGGDYVTVTTAWRWPSGSVLYVDHEGMLKPTGHFFRLAQRGEEPIAGNGVVVGKLDLMELRRSVRFLSRAEADAWGEDNADAPALSIADSHGRITILETWGNFFRRMPPYRE